MKLEIKSSNCMLRRGFGGEINGKEISKIIEENLPEEMEAYKNYPVSFSLSINFLGTDSLSVKHDGYDIPTIKESKQEESEEGENKND